ncbi:MAG TPA: DMT family transporter [Verrucomicrobiae bacterium]|jgi:transporter family-2 protein
MVLLLYILLALLLGVASSFQGTFNAALARQTSFPQALMINTSIVLLGTFVIFLVAPGGRTLQSLAKVPPHLYLGGVCGVVIISIAAWIFPRLGVGYAVVLGIVGQLLTALLIDHNGWFGIPCKPMTLTRVIGMILLLAGVWLVKR